ncbi:TetR/AcrR family transcriptional regulator [Phytomonospora endophytica]|uniref:AcrR family transcriptional regulator n=1 Tax=Phytomonospora endophytica TaxID=714109 RepID=A0A841FQ19_9ACTN|nr:TetR/AcrR family transcriptional regulator [Phytomonospora endophytica]MBB6034050.1 AcrR family transcriptional regulator [Phytomonospora endophytica]GIG71588.1 TetR family transcriptional regulator [Phytomonospora endophytica]
MSAPRTARERARAELTQAIKDTARRQLADVGSRALSLRAVARELGMVSSAVYRYFASLDELFTALIMDAYNAVGEQAELADTEAREAGATPAERWLAVSRAVRAWAIAHRHEYELLYGTPIPGYAAPQDTIAAASRTPFTLVRICNDAIAEGATFPADRPTVTPDLFDENMTGLVNDPTFAYPGRIVLAWSGLIGVITFELFGQFNGVITDFAAYFDYTARATAAELGLT